jgi:hypothetical protein
MAHLSKAIDEVRAQEAKELQVKNATRLCGQQRVDGCSRHRRTFRRNRRPNRRIFCDTISVGAGIAPVETAGLLQNSLAKSAA